ncbi:tRNA (N6-isopentenyl adenosine(37)-C2)-methylthiotransferase MiaB [Patescibacteria group bacterium]
MRSIRKLKTYYIKTYGCQMNYSDSERIETILRRAALHAAPNMKTADVIIFNTCSVRQSAEDRILGMCNNIKKLKEKRNDKLPITILTGCMAQRNERQKAQGSKQNIKYFKMLKKKVPWVDIILPIKDIERLPKLLTMQLCNYANKKTDNSKYLSIKPKYTSNYKAYVPISTGCNEFCAYCVVPFARGKLINRPANEIIDEVKTLVKRGYKDIMLLGQNVDAWRSQSSTHSLVQTSMSEPHNFLSLLKAVDSIPGDFWLSFLSSHPNYFTNDLIEYFFKSTNACTMRSGDRILPGGHIRPYINLALQSGSNKILKRMNRKYTIEEFINICSQLKSHCPQLNLSTDIIVGFPGETEKDFQKTVDVMERLEFDMAYINKYSPREGTAAAKLKDDVPWNVKKRRAEELNDILRKTALKNNRKYLGKKVKVLVEKVDEKNKVAFGKMHNFKDIRISPLASHSSLPQKGKFILVNVTKVNAWCLEGEVIE